MIPVQTTDFGRIVASTLGAILLSTVCVVGAVGPARAAEPQLVVAASSGPSTGLVGAVRY